MDEHQQGSIPQWAAQLFEQMTLIQNRLNDFDRSTTPSTSQPPTSRSHASHDYSEPQGQGAAASAIPTKQLGQLAEYAGSRAELEPWIAQAQAKLVVDYAGCSEITKFFVLHNRLRGEAARQLQPWVQAVVGTELAKVECLFEQLRLSFGDPHLKEKAQRKLHNLKQGQRPFIEYFTEFRQLVLEAGGMEWPDAIKKSYLEAGLSYELQRNMVSITNAHHTFDEYCSELKRVSDQLEALNARFRNARHTSHHGMLALQNKDQRAAKPDITMPMQHDKLSATRADRTPRISPDRMEWESTASSENAKRAKWVSEEEMGNRRAEGRCLRCGSSEHRIKDCEFKPARHPSKATKATVYCEPEVEEDVPHQTSSESGN